MERRRADLIADDLEEMILDGTLANEAVDTALERDPRYTLARLLRRMLEAGLRPPRGAGVGARPDRRSGGRSPMRL